MATVDPSGKKIYVWRDNATGEYYHDSCFEDDELREGFTAVVDLNKLEPDDECAACQIQFLESIIGDDESEDDC